MVLYLNDLDFVCQKSPMTLVCSNISNHPRPRSKESDGSNPWPLRFRCCVDILNGIKLMPHSCIDLIMTCNITARLPSAWTVCCRLVIKHSVGYVQYLTNWANKQFLEGLTCFKFSTRCIFMNMHVAYTRIGKQEPSVSTGTRQCEDRTFLIHLQSHCM